MIEKIACFVGWSNTGKTGFIASCAAALEAKGRRAAAIKLIKHQAGFNLEGKDSTRFFEACGRSAVISEAETIVITRTPSGWGREYAVSLFPEAEALLVEGRLFEGSIRVLVGGAATEARELKGELGDFDVVVTDHAPLAALARGLGLAVFGTGEADDFVSRYLM